jgi:hypothetical protein
MATSILLTLNYMSQNFGCEHKLVKPEKKIQSSLSSEPAGRLAPREHSAARLSKRFCAFVLWPMVQTEKAFENHAHAAWTAGVLLQDRLSTWELLRGQELPGHETAICR